MRHICRTLLLSIVAAILVIGDSTAAPPRPDSPETVMVTYLVRPGQEGELQRVIARHWETARKLNLVLKSPHLVLQGTESDLPYIIEIFTWRDASLPDNAPDAIQALWIKMGQLVQPRGDRPGLNFVPVHVLSSQFNPDSK
jgi:hypothetical protein